MTVRDHSLELSFPYHQSGAHVFLHQKRQLWPAAQEYQLPALVNRATGRTAAVLVPGPVVLAVKAALGAGAEAVDDVVTLPALMSRGGNPGWLGQAQKKACDFQVVVH